MLNQKAPGNDNFQSGFYNSLLPQSFSNSFGFDIMRLAAKVCPIFFGFLWLLWAQPEGGVLEKRRVCYTETCWWAGWAFSYRVLTTPASCNALPWVTMFILSTLGTVSDWPTHLPKGCKYQENTGSVGRLSAHAHHWSLMINRDNFYMGLYIVYRIIWVIFMPDVCQLERLC